VHGFRFCVPCKWQFGRPLEQVLAGAKPDEIVSDPRTTPNYAGRLCRCGVCGTVERCTPRSDFYVRPGETWLRCEGCVCTDAMPPRGDA
jgi:hypothetical protein